MKTKVILLAASACIASAQGNDIPHIVEPPPLTTKDIAWMEGISFTKGILPSEYDLRVGSISLVIEYEDGERETLIGPLSIFYPDSEQQYRPSQVGEVLVARRLVDGKHEFFLGWRRGGSTNSMKKSLVLKDVGISSTSTFDRDNGRMQPGGRYEVPIGESEIFTFLRTNKEPLAKVFVISEPVGSGQPDTHSDKP